MTEATTPATATEARAALDTRLADKDWGARILAGDVAANQEFHALTAAAALDGPDTVAAAMAGNPAYMPTGDMQAMAHTAGLFREIGIRDEVTREFLEGKQVSPQEYELVSNWKKEAMGDKAAGGFVERFLAGDVKARQQMTLANSVLVNGVKEAAAA